MFKVKGSNVKVIAWRYAGEKLLNHQLLNRTMPDCVENLHNDKLGLSVPKASEFLKINFRSNTQQNGRYNSTADSSIPLNLVCGVCVMGLGKSCRDCPPANFKSLNRC